MPISPENKARYPANWAEIRQSILRRANNRCEQCSLHNHDWIIRDHDGEPVGCYFDREESAIQNSDWRAGERPVKIILTIAHLDHIPEHSEPDNLMALCQQCHLRYDTVHHRESRYMNKRKNSGNLELFG